MCGIAGAIDGSVGRAAAWVELLNEGQSHRGPDHSVVARVGAFTLGNTRLAIQDPSPDGNQPFVSADRRFTCVFNGEIYNYRRLIKRYGLHVRSSCDGEIVPELWSKLGVASVAELRGMFAIAVVDSLEERLYLARDAFGIKPLYWRRLPHGLLFASEVAPLARIAGNVRIDPDAVTRFLHLGAVAADRSPFLEIMAVPPSCVVSFDLTCRASTQTVQLECASSSRADAQDLGAVLTDSVELHLDADVPTALLLSAGVDSGAIAAVSRRLGQDLNCLTIATEGSADESVEAQRTARHYGHRFLRVPAALEDSDVANFLRAMQRPSIDGLNTYIVSKAVHQAGFKVALSGLGGDEAVGGYSHFRLLKYLPALRVLDRLPTPSSEAVVSVLSRMGTTGSAKVKRLFAVGGPRDGWGLCHLQREVFPASLVAALTGTECPETAESSALPPFSGGGPFAAMVAAEVAIYLQAMLLPDADGFSMASSVELRVPFVDPQVFATTTQLAAGKRVPPGKAAIGTALGDPYLRWLATRRKRGFSLPMRRWMTGPLAPVLKAANEPDAAVWSFVDRRVAQRAGLVPLLPRERWSEPWALAVLNSWLEVH
jgi:asparagine synthase (glutamine-hydrolysing)